MIEFMEAFIPDETIGFENILVEKERVFNFA